MPWFRKRLSAARVAALARRAEEYAAGPADPSARLAFQLDGFNRCWRDIIEYVQYYKKMAADGRAPREFESWDQVLATLPAVDRPFLYQNFSALADTRRPAEYFRVTGGSTAAPVQLPAWNSERKQTAPDMWWGRSWYGIEPFDPLFLLWGHRHLLGTGWQGFKNARKRQLKDRVLGYTRFPAYDLSTPALHRAGQALERSRSAYMVGYSVALDRFARALQGRPLALKRPLKAVIGTAESFPFADSEQVVAAVFQAPAAMEYGAVETNLIAHTAPEGGYRAFWRNYFLEARERGPSGGFILRVTSLYPRGFPLLRYEIGDEIQAEAPGYGLAGFQRVLGRCNDYLEFPDGLKIHSEAITHSLSGVKELSGYQMVQEEGRLILRVTLREPLPAAQKDGIRRRLAQLHPALDPVEIEAVEALARTVAGKTPMVIRRPK